MSKLGEIRGENECFDYAGDLQNLYKENTLKQISCHGDGGNQHWVYNNGRIRNDKNFCVELNKKTNILYMAKCDEKYEGQAWEWKIKTNKTKT